MASAPSTGSSIAGPDNGNLDDLTRGRVRILADNSFSTASHNGAVWNYKSLTASGNTLVKTGAGQLHMVICATATGSVTLYDGTDNTGTVILATSALAVGSTTWDVSFGKGLFVVLSGAGVASVTYL